MLFDLVKAEGIKFNNDEKNGIFESSGSEFPQGLHDYHGSAPDGAIYTSTNKYGVVTNIQPEKSNGNGQVSNITARCLLWIIPPENKKS
jgi:hypothetical protein